MKYRYECLGEKCRTVFSEFRLMVARDEPSQCPRCRRYATQRVLFPKPSPVGGRGVFPGSQEIITPGAAPGGKRTYGSSREVDVMLKQAGVEWIPNRNLDSQGHEISNPVG